MTIDTLAINEIHEGDCLEVMRDIPDGSIDMILCDLPYGSTRNKWDSIIPLDELWAHYVRIIKDDGAIVLMAQTPFDKVLGVSNIKLLRYEWVWEKVRATGHLNAKKMPMKAHENILVFYKMLPTYNPQITDGHKPLNTTYGKGTSGSENYGKFEIMADTSKRTTRLPRSVQKVNGVNTNSAEYVGHGTQKPVSLMEYLVRTYTNSCETVLDNCIGSGTTAVAAINSGRNFIGIEQDTGYVAIARQRVNDAIAAKE